MKERDILRFAKENGYDGIEPLGTWRGFDVYEPVFSNTVKWEKRLKFW